jgi:hypothetical protein
MEELSIENMTALRGGGLGWFMARTPACSLKPTELRPLQEVRGFP